MKINIVALEMSNDFQWDFVFLLVLKERTRKEIMRDSTS